MELCTIRGAIQTPPLSLSSSRRFFATNPSFRKLPNISGGGGSRLLLLRASSDESGSKFTEKTSDAVIATLEDDVSSPFVDNDITHGNVSPVNVNDKFESSSEDDDETSQPIKELFNRLDIELDVEDTPTILLYGGGAIVAVWLLSAIIGAIDSIPVFPKLMEVVGLGYSVWFTARYLLFKKNREELGSKIEELKREVLGSSDK